MPPVEPTERPPGSIRSRRTQDLVDAAFAILDAEGPDALTMRRLADDLGMRAPSLYKHVRDKATLEAALIEDVLFDMGDVLHAALAKPGRQGVVRQRPARPTAPTPSPTRTATGSPPAAASAATCCRSASRSGRGSRSSSPPATPTARRRCGASPTGW